MRRVLKRLNRQRQSRAAAFNFFNPEAAPDTHLLPVSFSGDYHRAPVPGQDAPAFTLGTRGSQPDLEASPLGPGAYNVGGALPSGPAFTMRGRTGGVEEAVPGAEAPGK